MPGVQYTFEDSSGKKVVIRKEPGHYYGPNNSQNRGKHFHDTKGGHYDYE